jgi:hypothetical protein
MQARKTAKWKLFQNLKLNWLKKFGYVFVSGGVGKWWGLFGREECWYRDDSLVKLVGNWSIWKLQTIEWSNKSHFHSSSSSYFQPFSQPQVDFQVEMIGNELFVCWFLHGAWGAWVSNPKPPFEAVWEENKDS